MFSKVNITGVEANFPENVKHFLSNRVLKCVFLLWGHIIPKQAVHTSVRARGERLSCKGFWEKPLKQLIGVWCHRSACQTRLSLV